MRTDWSTRDENVPGWTAWQLMLACVFPELDMRDEVDQVELGDRAWVCLEGEN